MISETTLEQLGNVTIPNTVRYNCNQEQIQYLRMFVMQNLERNDVNMTYHGVQSKKNTIKTADDVIRNYRSYLILPASNTPIVLLSN
ncbi:hypothetical protein T06_4806 [Trichinella sp. T6]|nr:hypothetical protein T06_4806 [Trichinella sp. T6]